MSAQDRAIQKLARELAGIKKEVVSWRGPQADYTSIENGGNFTFKDSDGNVTAVVGGQDDGSNTIRHVDGPTPPVPTGLSAHVDGPIVQVSWDGTFETDVTHDWHYLEVLAVGPSNEQLTGTINDLSGGETSLAATAQGDWFITARSVSRAGKRSLDGDAGTVTVQLVGLTGAIEAVQESANGKNAIYYSPTEPTPPELGFNNGDLWFDTSEEGNNQASVWDGNGWVSMEDARLATIIAAQEELESDLTDVQTSVNGKNTITWDPAAPTLTTPGKAVNDIWYRTSGNSIIGYWKWSGSAWVQQTLSATVIPQIDIGTGTFGNLSGGRMQADSITVDKLLIGSGASLLPWSVATPAPHIATGGNVLTAITDPNIGPCIQSSGGTSTGWVEAVRFYRDANSFVLPTSPDSPYVFTATVSGAGTVPAGGWKLRVFVGWYNASGTYFTGSFGPEFTGVPSGSVNTISLTATSPAGAYGVRVALQAMGPLGSSRLLVKEARFEKQTGATLIQDGGITTPKLSADVLEVKNLKATSGQLDEAVINKLFSDVVVAKMAVAEQFIGENAILTGAVTAPKITASEELWAKIGEFVKIRAEQLEADAIDGMVITGATIRSNATGARTQQSASGIEVYNAENLRTFYASAIDGSLSIIGELSTDVSTKERVLLTNGLWNSIQVFDDEGTYVGTAPGAGIRIGTSSANSLEMYHAGKSGYGGNYTNSGTLGGPRMSSGYKGAVLTLSTVTTPGGTEYGWSSWYTLNPTGTTAGRVSIGGSGSSGIINLTSDKRIRSTVTGTDGKGGQSIVPSAMDFYIEGSSGTVTQTMLSDYWVVRSGDSSGSASSGISLSQTEIELRAGGSGGATLGLKSDGTFTGLPIATGSFTYGAIEGGGGSYERTVTLPAGRFKNPPSVTAITASPRTTPAIDLITTTSFRIRLYNFTSSSAPNNDTTWIAADQP